jgi:general secretion pathway protein D
MFNPFALSSLSLSPLARWNVVLSLASLLCLPALAGGAGEATQQIAFQPAVIAAQQAEALNLYRAGKYAEATAAYKSILKAVPAAPVTKALRTEIKEGYAAAACAQALELLPQGRYTEANELISSVLAADMLPQHAYALKLRKQAANPDRYPPALTPDHLAKVKKVEDQLLLAESCVQLGDYDRAAMHYEQVLRADRYNIAARRGLELVEQKKAEYYDAAKDHARAKALTQVSRQWENPVPPASIDLGDSFGLDGGVRSLDREGIQQKLRNLILPKVDFSGATLDEAVEYFRVTTKNIDPEGRGIDFVVNAGDVARGKSITLNLTDTPVEEVLRYTVELAGAAYRVDNRAVIITSLSEKSTNLIARSYIVPPDFIQTAPVEATPTANDPFGAAQPSTAISGIKLQRMTAKDFLTSRGVTFPEGTSANYNPANSTLFVRNTEENLLLIDSLVEIASKNKPKQAMISVKMLEVTEKAFKEIGTSIAVGEFNIGSKTFASGGGQGTETFSVTDGNRSSGPIVGSPSIDQLLSLARGQEVPAQNSSSPAAFSLLGVLNDPQFTLLIKALSQQTGKDVLASPSILAKSGQKSSIRIVREFPYPTEFDPPEIPQNLASNQVLRATFASGVTIQAGSSGSGPITPTTPTAFEVKEIGTVLEVEPIISEDGRTVELSIAPKHSEFEGFVDYGSDIRNRISNLRIDLILEALIDDGVPFIVDNPILQPVFRENRLSTAVKIYDGSTVVLGGLQRQEVIDIEDKTPIVGNLPLIGRGFQSQVSQTITKHILFFVTVDVIDAAGRKLNQSVVTSQP